MIIVGGRGEWLGDATKKAVESGLRDLSLGAMGYHCASPNQLRPSVDCV